MTGVKVASGIYDSNNGFFKILIGESSAFDERFSQKKGKFVISVIHRTLRKPLFGMASICHLAPPNEWHIGRHNGHC